MELERPADGLIGGEVAVGVAISAAVLLPDTGCRATVRSRGELSTCPATVRSTIRGAVGIQLAVKLSPYYTSFTNFARRVVEAGADVVKLTSALLHTGPEHVGEMKASWWRGWPSRSTSRSPSCGDSVSGSATEDTAAFERANHVQTLYSWTAPTELTPSSPTG